MKNLKPISPDTLVDPITKEWIPRSFDSFLEELNHVTRSCTGPHPLPVFRGHSKRSWLLDSTFARSCKERIFGIPAGESYSSPLAISEELHYVLLNCYLLKYGIQVQPSAELETVWLEHGVDPWWELMRRHQQYPNDDRPPFMGSNLMDWTRSFNVALYFANLNRSGEGAVFICDSFATGRTFQIIPVSKILQKMREAGNSGKALGCPLMFHHQYKSRARGLTIKKRSTLHRWT
jgi:hypothetical protein